MILDLFAGPGGWDEGARDAGIEGPIGIEIDRDACATRAAAGHLTVRADVMALPYSHIAPQVHGLIASPPCQTFSLAGNCDGLLDTREIIEHSHRCVTGWSDYDLIAFADTRSALVLEALRAALQLVPTWIAFEQVPAVLPIWETFSHVLRANGWFTWCGLLNSADYGVPQTRVRALLLANRQRQPMPPPPTHARHPMPTLFGPELENWVSMAAALGWGFDDRGSPTITGGHEAIAGHETRQRLRDVVVNTTRTTRYEARQRISYERPVLEPAPTLTARAAGWRVYAVNTGRDWKPGGTRADAQLIDIDEPAPTVDGCGVWHAMLIDESQAENAEAGFPGANLRFTLRERLILQSFREDYPVQGDTKTSTYKQVGNAIPPLLARRCLEAVAR